MDRYQAMVEQFHPHISELAQKMFEETGRGFVTLALTADMALLRWAALEGNVPKPPKKGKGIKVKTRPEIQSAFRYNPATTAVVLVVEATPEGDEPMLVMEVPLAPDTGGLHLADLREFERGVQITARTHFHMGGDEALLNRQISTIVELARRGHTEKGAGAVVIARERPSAHHWLVGHLEGDLPADEGSFIYYVPVDRLREGPVNSGEALRDYDPRSEAHVVFLHPGATTLTHTISF